MQTIRPDGLRILTKNLPNTKRVELAVMIKTGSASDPMEKLGLFHFIEHMGFQGTATRSKKELKELLERYTLNSNAYTARLSTVYWAETIQTRVENVLDVLVDNSLRMNFPVEEIERERSVILHELERYEDDDHHQLYHQGLYPLLYRAHYQIEYGVGTKTTLAQISREDLIQAHRDFYVPENIVVVATGAVDHEEIVSLVNQKIIENSTRVEQKNWDTEENIVPQEKEFVLERPNRQKATLCFGAKLPVMTDKQEATLRIFNNMMFRGFDSIFFREIRENRSLAYSVNGNYSGSVPLGYFLWFLTESSPAQVPVLKELMPDLVFNYELEEKHFNRIKDSIEDFSIVSMEYPDDWRKFFLANVTDKRDDLIIKTDTYLADRLNLIRSVTFEDVKEIRALIRPEHLVNVLMVPKKFS
jgi:predicted Zn-dependent peptidase